MATYPAQYGVHYVLCDVCGRSTPDKVRRTCHDCEMLVRSLWKMPAWKLQRALRIAHRSSYLGQPKTGKSLALDLIHGGPVGLKRWKFLREVGDTHLTLTREQESRNAELRSMLRESYPGVEDERVDELVKEATR